MREFVHGDDSHTPVLFQQFKDTHGKAYEGRVEHQNRQHIFRQNVRWVRHNIRWVTQAQSGGSGTTSGGSLRHNVGWVRHNVR